VQELLERMDDAPGDALKLEEFFDHPWPSELRLWETIDRQILVPFNYFAVDDGTDVRNAWKRGRYLVSELSSLYTSDHVWLDRVARAVETNIRDPREMRAIAFCVDARHRNLSTTLRQRRFGILAVFSLQRLYSCSGIAGLLIQVAARRGRCPIALSGAVSGGHWGRDNRGPALIGDFVYSRRAADEISNPFFAESTAESPRRCS
jgi:hypothetical protein